MFKYVSKFKTYCVIELDFNEEELETFQVKMEKLFGKGIMDDTDNETNVNIIGSKMYKKLNVKNINELDLLLDDGKITDDNDEPEDPLPNASKESKEAMQYWFRYGQDINQQRKLINFFKIKDNIYYHFSEVNINKNLIELLKRGCNEKKVEELLTTYTISINGDEYDYGYRPEKILLKEYYNNNVINIKIISKYGQPFSRKIFDLIKKEKEFDVNNFNIHINILKYDSLQNKLNKTPTPRLNKSTSKSTSDKSTSMSTNNLKKNRIVSSVDNYNDNGSSSSEVRKELLLMRVELMNLHPSLINKNIPNNVIFCDVNMDEDISVINKALASNLGISTDIYNRYINTVAVTIDDEEVILEGDNKLEDLVDYNPLFLTVELRQKQVIINDDEKRERMNEDEKKEDIMDMD